MIVPAAQLSQLLDQVIDSVALMRPELCIIATFVLVILSNLFVDKHYKHSSFVLTVLGLFCTLFFLFQQTAFEDSQGFFDMYLIDSLSVKSRIIIVFFTIVIAFFTKSSEQDAELGDFFSLLLGATLGLFVLSSTTNWLLTFIGIELISISSYILVGYFSQDKQQAEASMKYALFGAVCSAVMLYGLSFLYGFTGSLNFADRQYMVGMIEAPDALVYIALLFVFVGIGFKLSFVPLHLWSPDVYEGAPTAVTAFLSTLPKIAVITFLVRLIDFSTITNFTYAEFSTTIIIVASIASMLIGNLVALVQRNAKRMLAYSSIGHTGILLMLSLYLRGNENTLFYYLTAYSLMNIGTFMCIAILEKKNGDADIAKYKGLGKSYPILFSCLTILLISLVGLPPTMGFVGKLLVFSEVFESYQESHSVLTLWLLIIGALTSVISLFYYFKIPLYAFLREQDLPIVRSSAISKVLFLTVLLFTIFILLLGVFPNWMMNVLSI